jgi:hypothetical protein
MARRNSEAALLAAKARKQKIVIIALAPILLGLLAWQGPKTYKALTGGTPPPPLPVAAPTPTAPTGTTTGVAPGQLPESDPRPSLLDGQLLSFSRFSGRDPFVPPTTSGTSDDTPAVTDDATIEVNGTAEDLAIGDSFPAGDPTFTLVSTGPQSAQIGLVSGTFSNGDETITINVGETLVLQADDGARYAIKLVSVAAA